MATGWRAERLAVGQCSPASLPARESIARCESNHVAGLHCQLAVAPGEQLGEVYLLLPFVE